MKKFIANRKYKVGNLFEEEALILRRTKCWVYVGMPDGTVKWGYLRVVDSVEEAHIKNETILYADKLCSSKAQPPVAYIIKYGSEETEGSLESLLIVYAPKLKQYAGKRVPQKPQDIEKLVEYLNRCAVYDNADKPDYLHLQYTIVNVG